MYRRPCYEPYGTPLSDSFFCALSAISNTGLGTEVTGLSENYALIPDAAKWLLSLYNAYPGVLRYLPSFCFSPHILEEIEYAGKGDTAPFSRSCLRSALHDAGRHDNTQGKKGTIVTPFRF